ncbi:MAG TPA: hypothetical protein VJN44_19390, partial [Roseateles sp.]|nr:hypothetical protein [Roseateles sp.]
MKRMLALWLATALASGAAQALARIDAALDAQLDRLVQQAYDTPARSQQGLAALRREQGGRHGAQLLMAEAQILVQAGRVAEAEKIAGALQADLQQRGRVALLRALIAERTGRNQEAAAAAEAALTELEPPCAGGGLAERDCDFRMAWAALRILEREQVSQGALAQAAAIMRQALGLAQGGSDPHLTAISMGSLALLSQNLEQPEEARRWLSSALEQARDDPLTMARTKVVEARIAVRRGDRLTQLQSYEEALDFAQQ